MLRWFTGLLTICLIAALTTPVFAALPSGTGRITSNSQISGSEFSSKSSIAKKLDKMFAGDIGLYKDKGKTKLVDASLGTRNVPNNGVWQYWGPTPRAGTSCFAYANAFYGYFYDGVYPHHSINGNHQKIKATGRISYENFVKWGVRDDAVVYIREGNHSIVVLSYDKNYITYADGNGDGKGLIAIRKEAWKRGSGANIYNQKPSLIVQPTTAYFPKGNMKSQGAVPCTQGGNSHDWDEAVITKKATCKETGTKVYTCLDCKLTREETIKKTTDHVLGEWTVTKESTCSAKGEKVAKCSVCGNEQKKSIKALGHQYGKAEPSQEATIYSAGVTKKTCQRCGKVKKIKSDCVVQDTQFGMTLTTKEGVFPKKTQLTITGPEDPEAIEIALREVTAKSFVFVLDTRVEDVPVQPEGAVTLEIEIPEDFGNNLGLYQITEGKIALVESAIDPQTRTLTATVESVSTFALCDLDVPYIPEPTEPETQPATEPVTEPITQSVTEPASMPAVVLTEAKQTGILQNRELILWVASVAVLFVGLVTLTVILIVRKAKKRKVSATAEIPQEQTAPEVAEPEGEAGEGSTETPAMEEEAQKEPAPEEEPEGAPEEEPEGAPEEEPEEAPEEEPKEAEVL